MKKYYPRDGDDLIPLPELEDEDKEYKVEEIKDKNLKKGYVRYLVKWLGWPSEYNQWVPEADIVNVIDKIRSFERSRKRKR